MAPYASIQQNVIKYHGCPVIELTSLIPMHLVIRRCLSRPPQCWIYSQACVWYIAILSAGRASVDPLSKITLLRHPFEQDSSGLVARRARTGALPP